MRDAKNFADHILKTMKSSGYDVRESDPFAQEQRVAAIVSGVPPIVARLKTIWESQRQFVLDNFPPAPGLPGDKNRYMKFVDDIYQSDAYHSL